MNAIQLTLDQKVYKASRDEIKEQSVCELTSYEDGKMRIMLLPDKAMYLINKTATNINGNIFFTPQEAENHRKKMCDMIVNRSISALIRAGRNCVEMLQKYGKR